MSDPLLSSRRLSASGLRLKLAICLRMCAPLPLFLLPRLFLSCADLEWSGVPLPRECPVWRCLPLVLDTATSGKASVRGVDVTEPRPGRTSKCASSIVTSSFFNGSGLCLCLVVSGSSMFMPSSSTSSTLFLASLDTDNDDMSVFETPLVLPFRDLLSATEAGRLTSFSGSSECCRFDVELEF